MNILLALLSPVLVYVANQASGKVTVIDAATDSVVAVVDFTTLGFSAHPKPHHIVVEPDGSYWYVSLVGDNAVVKLDRSNHVVASRHGDAAARARSQERQAVRDAVDVGRQRTGAHRGDQPQNDDARRSRGPGAAAARARGRARRQARLRREPRGKSDRRVRCEDRARRHRRRTGRRYESGDRAARGVARWKDAGGHRAAHRPAAGVRSCRSPSPAGATRADGRLAGSSPSRPTAPKCGCRTSDRTM